MRTQTWRPSQSRAAEFVVFSRFILSGHPTTPAQSLSIVFVAMSSCFASSVCLGSPDAQVVTAEVVLAAETYGAKTRVFTASSLSLSVADKNVLMDFA